MGEMGQSPVDYEIMPIRLILLTHWGWVTHICVSKLNIIGSDNGLWPGQRQAIIWTNAGILLTGPLGTNFSEILIEIQTFSLKKIRLKMSSAKRCSFHLGLNVLKPIFQPRSAIRFLDISLSILHNIWWLSLGSINGWGHHLKGYHQTSNISHTLVGNKLVDHLDVVGASPVGAAPTTSSFLT